MATASVHVTFEAASVEEAQTLIATWSLPEGARIFVNITEGQTSSSGVVDSGGNLVISVPEVPDEPPS
jgi:hypothetical protein